MTTTSLVYKTKFALNLVAGISGYTMEKARRIFADEWTTFLRIYNSVKSITELNKTFIQNVNNIGIIGMSQEYIREMFKKTKMELKNTIDYVKSNFSNATIVEPIVENLFGHDLLDDYAKLYTAQRELGVDHSILLTDYIMFRNIAVVTMTSTNEALKSGEYDSDVIAFSQVLKANEGALSFVKHRRDLFPTVGNKIFDEAMYQFIEQFYGF